MNTVFISSTRNDDTILSDDSFILNNKDIQRVKSPVSNTSAINFNSMINNTSGSSSSDDTNTIFSDAISLSTNERCGSTNTIASTEENINSKLLSNYLNIPRDDYPIKDNDFLNHINPFPSKPPSYTKMNPNRLIRYPIYENIKPCSINEKPPIYSPTVENFTIVSIKSEYLSPYEPSNSKIWKNFIMEINSTQLNFYYIDSSLTHRIKNYSSGCDYNTNGLYHLDNSARAKFFNFNHKATYNFNKYDQEHICYQIQRSKKKFLSQERLYKSFSLQFAKFGIPIDYNKKTFVLRMRCESEQFLINFAHVDDMINWTTYLSMGISVSLDLELREMPDYRIVPRRRRRRRRRRRHSHHRRHGFVTSSNSSGNNGRSRSHSNSFSSRRTRDIMTSHLSESALGALSESVSRKNSFSNSRKNSNSSSNTQSLDQSFSSMSLDTSSRNSTNNRNSSRRCSSINLQDSPYNIISNSKSNNSSGTNLKSKLKGLFKIGYTPQKSTPTSNNTPVIPINIPSSPRSRSRSGSATNSTTTNAMSFISVSPTNTTLSSPVMRSNSFKNNYSTATSLNSLIEDEDENDESLPGGMQFSRKQDPALRSISSSPLYQAAHMKVPQYICPKDTTTTSSASNPTHRLVQRNSIILQHELDELHEVLREHQDSDMEDDGDEDEDEDEMEEDDTFDEMQHRNTSVITTSSSYNRMNSVYSDEGIFHDSDTEEQDYYPNFRNRASSLMSSLSYGVGNDEVKWHPPICETSRKRYIRNSLRCIRPFLEDNEWVGFVCFKPTRCPPYETNNRPINYNGKDSTSKNRKNSNNSHHVQDYTNVKNHYLESFVVGPVDFIKADTPTIRRINKIKTKKNKDDDVESRLLLAYGS